MKLKGHVTKVDDRGDVIRIEGQAFGVADAQWRSWVPISFDLAATDTAKRTYHVGRKFVVTIEVSK